MTVDTARSWDYLLGTLVPNQPEPEMQTVLLAQAARDLITTLRITGTAPDGYNFSVSPQVILSGTTRDPNRTITAGVAATLYLPQAIPGVNGNDTAHYVMILDGVTFNTVLITGGTTRGPTAANPSGTPGTLILAATSSSFSGRNWTLQSATSGVAEAIVGSPNTLIRLGAAVYTLFAPITVPLTCPGIIGAGSSSSYFNVYFTTGNIINLANTGTQFVTFRSFTINPVLGTMTSGAAIAGTGAGNFIFDDLGIGLGGLVTYVGISLTSVANNVTVISNTIIYCDFVGIYCVSYLSLSNVKVLGIRTYLGGASPYLAGSAAMIINRGVGGNIVGFFHDAGYFEAGIIYNVASVAINELHLVNVYLDNWGIKGLTVVGANASLHCKLVGSSIFNSNIGVNDATQQSSAALELAAGVNNWEISSTCLSFGVGFGLIYGGAQDVNLSGVDIIPAVDGIVTPGTAVLIQNTAGGKNLKITGCDIGQSFFAPLSKATKGIECLLATFDGLFIDGGSVEALTQANKIVLTGTETRVSIGDVGGIGNVFKTVVAAAALAFPLMQNSDTLTVTGNTNVTSVTGLREGQRGVIIPTGTPTWTQGNNIGSPNLVSVPNTPYAFSFTNGLLWIG